MIPGIVEKVSKKLNIGIDKIKTFSSSYCTIQDDAVLMVAAEQTKYLSVAGNGSLFKDFEGDIIGQNLKLCPLSHSNRLVLNKYFDYTIPRAFGKNVPTFGAGDRLGLASPGHIKVISKSLGKPILAQQSKRELELTKRTYQDVLDSVTFAVFQEGYKGGFGADGDHLKHEEDIMDALKCGYSMITLDCSEKIRRDIENLTIEEIKKQYDQLPLKTRDLLESKYLGKTFVIDGYKIRYTQEELIKNTLIYYEAITFIIYIYNTYIIKCNRAIDFEISIDETESITSEFAHLLVASEIIDAGVSVNSIAPRFIGEFQKGIDYIGDIDNFEDQLKIHAAIADHFGYKLSIHSGSDKFSVFQLIGLHTNQRLHIKTSGTNWLEAVGTIAQCNPSLYRIMHKCALNHFEEAKSYYHVSANLSNVPDISTVSDDRLCEYLEDDHSRQLLHITYGFILSDSKIKSSIYNTLIKNEDIYIKRLEKHIGRHLELVGLM